MSQSTTAARGSFSTRSILYTVYRHHYNLTHEQARDRIAQDMSSIRALPGAQDTQRKTLRANAQE